MAERIPRHHAEVWVEDSFVSGERVTGWQCLTPGCGQEESGLTFKEAEQRAHAHEASIEVRE